MTRSSNGDPEKLRFYVLADEGVDAGRYYPITEEQRRLEKEEIARWKAFWFGSSKGRRTATAQPADTCPLKDPELARKLRLARKFAGFTTTAAASSLGLTMYTLGNYEHARAAVPAMVLYRMGVLYRRDLHWFFNDQVRRYDPHREVQPEPVAAGATPDTEPGGDA